MNRAFYKGIICIMKLALVLKTSNGHNDNHGCDNNYVCLQVVIKEQLQATEGVCEYAVYVQGKKEHIHYISIPAIIWNVLYH